MTKKPIVFSVPVSCSIFAYNSSVADKCKKVRNFFRQFRTEILRIPAFLFCQKLAFLFPAKNHRQLWFTAPRPCMSHKARRKLAGLRRRSFFFPGDQHKIEKKDGQREDLFFFFFLEITLKTDKKMRKIFSTDQRRLKSSGIFTLSSEFRTFALFPAFLQVVKT